MLFDRVSTNIFRPVAAIAEGAKHEGVWEETCDPGRLWIMTAVRDGETIIELWIAYITSSRYKLLRAPAPVRLLQSSPQAQAHEALKSITGLNTNWSTLGSQPPNEKSKGLALRVLESIFAAGMRTPKVTISAEGGVAIVYKDKNKYAAIETLNRGSLWMLWFDSGGNPQSRRINLSNRAIRLAVEHPADQIRMGSSFGCSFTISGNTCLFR